MIYRVPAPDEAAILRESAERDLRNGLRRERQRFWISLALFLGAFVLAGASIGAWLAFDVLASR